MNKFKDTRIYGQLIVDDSIIMDKAIVNSQLDLPYNQEDYVLKFKGLNYDTLLRNSEGILVLKNHGMVDYSPIATEAFVASNVPDLTPYVKISDIVDNLTSTDTNKPLSANQGKVLNETTAKLAASNVFTQPQIVPNAENDDEAVNLGQMNTHIRSNYYDKEKVDIIMEDLDTHIKSNYYDKDYIDDLEKNITQHVASNYYDINEIDNKLKSLVVDGGSV